MQKIQKFHNDEVCRTVKQCSVIWYTGFKYSLSVPEVLFISFDPHSMHVSNINISQFGN